MFVHTQISVFCTVAITLSADQEQNGVLVERV